MINNYVDGRVSQVKSWFPIDWVRNELRSLFFYYQNILTEIQRR